MKAIEIMMPAILLGMAFLLKLFIDRTITIPDTLASILDLPADIAFFSLSLIVAYAISKPENYIDGFMRFSMYTLATLIVIFLWRRSISCFYSGQRAIPLIAGGLNYVITLLLAFHAINLVRGA